MQTSRHNWTCFVVLFLIIFKRMYDVREGDIGSIGVVWGKTGINWDVCLKLSKILKQQV